MSRDDSETEAVSRALAGMVDIGSNGVRFSISSKASHHARIMPCVFKDRVGISLFDVQYTTASKAPIPDDTIAEICAAMKRFKLICEDFGVPESQVRIVATEATREAYNSQEFRDAIYDSTGWEVELLSKQDEGKIGAYGVASSFNMCSGLFMDLGGGPTQISWIRCVDGEITVSSTPVSLPYGAAALSRRMALEDKKALFMEIKHAYEEAIKTINIPQNMLEDAERRGGFSLYTCGGGLRGMGHVLLSEIKDYPIQTIINGFSVSSQEFTNMADYLFLKGKMPGEKVFKVSERRAQQLPAVGLLLSAAMEAIPKVRTVHFSEGGVREGTFYTMLPREIRSQDPIVVATRPYAPLLADKYLALLRSAMPNDIPQIVYKRIAPALCNMAFVHASYPKELQSTAGLHVGTTGIISGSYGLSHRVRALMGIALCNRWGGDIPQSEEYFNEQLEKVVWRHGEKSEQERDIWWTKYIGTVMYVICGVHPGGNIRDGVFNFKVKENAEESTKYEVVVSISKDELKTSASVRARILTLQKKVKKLSKGSQDKVKISVEYAEDDM